MERKARKFCVFISCGVSLLFLILYRRRGNVFLLFDSISFPACFIGGGFSSTPSIHTPFDHMRSERAPEHPAEHCHNVLSTVVTKKHVGMDKRSVVCTIPLFGILANHVGTTVRRHHVCNCDSFRVDHRISISKPFLWKKKKVSTA